MARTVIGNVRKTKPHNRNPTLGDKAHPDKNRVLVNRHRHTLVYLRSTQAGQKHDHKQADDAALVFLLVRPLARTLAFRVMRRWLSSPGTPRKRRKVNPLRQPTDKALNTLLSSARIGLEPTLSGLKRCPFVKEVFRCSALPRLEDLTP